MVFSIGLFPLVFSPCLPPSPHPCLINPLPPSFTSCLPFLLNPLLTSFTSCLPPSPPACLLYPLSAIFTSCLPPLPPVCLLHILSASLTPCLPPSVPPFLLDPCQPGGPQRSPPSPSMWECGLGPHTQRTRLVLQVTVLPLDQLPSRSALTNPTPPPMFQTRPDQTRPEN